ncbi:Ger(x)C family spore germination protein [Pseudalkalibacillus berkeleyi]|uniref:Ger(X)C family spore germination protein n=1 Tax=Pseudalkalibacillus berkeleyi TaxID=1069813 RepID=A0ABS9H3S2_9BACL|nr:Ger(x)C family spore germination protein [Pseudalkalibacillus berkeleyi]MCF6138487.1 Ger(x)C family spore germination protein [Pseudalkalibacillus berkeleyi]
MSRKSQFSICLLLSSSLLLSGCWDHNELPIYAYVQAIALDISEDNENMLELTTQFIKPAPKIGSAGGSGDQAFVNIGTEGDTVFEAVRDITNHLGRKAQWSHTRIILISEKLAESRNIGEMLEFFYRDHEPRMLINVGVTEGNAKDYLKAKPFIENTISQQLKEVGKAAHQYSSKTMEVNLLSLGRQLNSESQTSKIPYYKNAKSGEAIVSGLVTVNKGKVSGHITPLQSEALLMLLNEFGSGIVEIPCSDNPNLKEAVEVSSAKTDLKTKLENNDVKVHVNVNLVGSTGELKCTSVIKSERVATYNKKVEKVVLKNIKSTISQLQEDKIDLLGLGNEIYRRHPKQWPKMKKQWPEIFSNAKFEVHVKMNIKNTGADIGKPFFKK